MNFNKLIKYIVITFLLIILGIKCIFLFDILPPFIAIFGVMFILLLGIFIHKIQLHHSVLHTLKKYLKKIEKLSGKQMIFIVAFLSIMFRLIAIFVLKIDSINANPDIAVYVTSAKELAINGIVKSYAGYCLSFSHMFWFAGFLSPIVKLFGDSQIVLSIFLSVIDTISIILLFVLVAEKFSKTNSFIISIIVSLLPSMIFLPQYITHEHALLFFVSLTLWLYFYIMPKTNKIIKIFIELLAMLCLFLAILMNTAGLVLYIAFIIIFIIDALKKHTIRTFVIFCSKIIVMFCILIIGTSLFTSIQYSHSVINDSYVDGDKILWTLYVGGNVETNAQWSKDDAEIFDAWEEGASSKEIHEYRMNLLIERYKDLLASPDKFIELLKGKMTTIWGAFTYSIMYTSETITNSYIQQLYNSYFSKLLVMFEYGLSVIVLYICIFNNIKKSCDYIDDFNLLIYLFLMGYTAMLLLTECNNKYTIAMQPFFWIICLTSYKNSSKNSSIENKS